jgi:HlyD family secretion protein
MYEGSSGALLRKAGTADDVRRRLGIDGRARRRGVWRGAILLLLAAAVVFGVRAYWRQRTEGIAPKYETEAVTRADLRVTVSATGRLQGINTVEVGAEVTGRVLAVLVDYNDKVSKGQLLAEIDPELLRAAVEESRAQVLAAESAIATADANRVEADQALARARGQLAYGLVAEQEVEAAEAAAARAKAGRASARANAALARASLKSALSRLEKTKIFAPTAGVVLARLIEPGQTVTAGFQTPVLFKLAEDLAKLQLRVDVDEADVGRVGEGMQGHFTVDAYPGREFPSRILSLRNDPQTRQNVVTYEAVLSVENDSRALRPGMTATATIISETVGAALVIPNAALRFTPPPSGPEQPGESDAKPRGADKRVYVVRNEVLSPVRLKVGKSDGHVTEILDGSLALGDEVVVDAAAK